MLAIGLEAADATEFSIPDHPCPVPAICRYYWDASSTQAAAALGLTTPQSQSIAEGKVPAYLGLGWKLGLMKSFGGICAFSQPRTAVTRHKGSPRFADASKAKGKKKKKTTAFHVRALPGSLPAILQSPRCASQGNSSFSLR
jgi:hypothetical protein